MGLEVDLRKLEGVCAAGASNSPACLGASPLGLRQRVPPPDQHAINVKHKGWWPKRVGSCSGAELAGKAKGRGAAAERRRGSLRQLLSQRQRLPQRLQSKLYNASAVMRAAAALWSSLEPGRKATRGCSPPAGPSSCRKCLIDACKLTGAAIERREVTKCQEHAAARRGGRGGSVTRRWPRRAPAALITHPSDFWHSLDWAGPPCSPTREGTQTNAARPPSSARSWSSPPASSSCSHRGLPSTARGAMGSLGDEDLLLDVELPGAGLLDDLQVR